MSSTQDAVLGAGPLRTPTKRKKKTKRTGRPGKKRLEILLDDSKKAFDGWESEPEPWSLETCEEYIEWCHINKAFPHARYKQHWRADKANLHYCKWPIFKERCIEMYQHIYERPNLERNECPFLFFEWCMLRWSLGKRLIGWLSKSKLIHWWRLLCLHIFPKEGSTQMEGCPKRRPINL